MRRHKHPGNMKDGQESQEAKRKLLAGVPYSEQPGIAFKVRGSANAKEILLSGKVAHFSALKMLSRHLDEPDIIEVLSSPNVPSGFDRRTLEEMFGRIKSRENAAKALELLPRFHSYLFNIQMNLEKISKGENASF
jgi:hypothetical protein